MDHTINFNDLANGALAEQFGKEAQNVFANIADPNTDAKKERKLTITISFKADDKRDMVVSSFSVVPKLAPYRPIETKFMIGRSDETGRVVGAELKSGVPGQTYITETGDVAEDTGKIIDFQATKTQGGNN